MSIKLGLAAKELGVTPSVLHNVLLKRSVDLGVKIMSPNSIIEKFIHPIGIETIELPSQEILITFKVRQKEKKEIEMPACLMGKKL